MVREMGLSNSTVRKKMLRHIHNESYAFRSYQFMNAATKERNLAKANHLLNRLMAPAVNGSSSLTRKTSLNVRRSIEKATGGRAQTSLRSPS
jgi:hypothetical protein